jgi:hypothetical protein
MTEFTRTTLSITSGLVVSLGCGWACQQWLGRHPLIQSVVAMLSAWALASILPAVLWVLYPPPAADIAAVAFGFAEAAITSIAIAALAVGLHVLADLTLGPSIALTWRPVVLAVLAGICSAAACAYGMGTLRPLR